MEEKSIGLVLSFNNNLENCEFKNKGRQSLKTIQNLKRSHHFIVPTPCYVLLYKSTVPIRTVHYLTLKLQGSIYIPEEQ